MKGQILKSRKERIEDLIKEINYLLLNNPVTVLQISRDGLHYQDLAKNTFGPGSSIETEALIVVQDIQAINYIEEKLLTYIASNIDKFSIDSAEKVVLILNRLSQLTFKSYRKILEEIRNAIENKDRDRVLKPFEELDTLLTNKDYSNMVVALGENQANIKSFLNYEPEFWTFIKDKERIVPVPAEGALIECGIIPIYEGDRQTLHNFYTVVPKVIDMETACIAIELYKKAHEMYLMVGKDCEKGLQSAKFIEQPEYSEYLSKEAIKITK